MTRCSVNLFISVLMLSINITICNASEQVDLITAGKQATVYLGELFCVGAGGKASIFSQHP